MPVTPAARRQCAAALPDSFATARSSPMTPTPIDPTHPQALALMAQSEALMTALYPSESNHFEPAENLRPPHAHFVGLWEGERLMRRQTHGKRRRIR